MRIIKIALNIFYIIIVVLFINDGIIAYMIIPHFEIKNQFTKTFVWDTVLFFSPFLTLFNIITMKKIKNKILFVILPLFTIAWLMINFSGWIFSSSSWQTDIIMYENKNMKLNKIEFQMRALRTYKNRTVEIFYITPLFMIVLKDFLEYSDEDFEKYVLDKKWIFINKEINELGLFFP
jgi:hypothetical protein